MIKGLRLLDAVRADGIAEGCQPGIRHRTSSRGCDSASRALAPPEGNHRLVGRGEARHGAAAEPIPPAAGPRSDRQRPSSTGKWRCRGQQESTSAIRPAEKVQNFLALNLSKGLMTSPSRRAGKTAPEGTFNGGVRIDAEQMENACGPTTRTVRRYLGRDGKG